MNKFYLLAIFIIICFTASAQTFKDLKKNNGENPFYEDNYKIYLRHTSVNSKYTENYSGITVNIAVRNDSYKNGTLG